VVVVVVVVIVLVAVVAANSNVFWESHHREEAADCVKPRAQLSDESENESSEPRAAANIALLRCLD
jgi:hypothetical protein